MTQNDKVKALIDKIAYDVQDFFNEFTRPARSSIILNAHKSAISRLGLDWHTVELELKKSKLVRIKRHEKTNKKWYFPPVPEYEDAALAEMVSLMDN